MTTLSDRNSYQVWFEVVSRIERLEVITALLASMLVQEQIPQDVEDMLREFVTDIHARG